MFPSIHFSVDSGVAMTVPYTAFEDPNTPEGAPFREPIDVRAFVFYEEDKRSVSYLIKLRPSLQ